MGTEIERISPPLSGLTQAQLHPVRAARPSRKERHELQDEREEETPEHRNRQRSTEGRSALPDDRQPSWIAATTAAVRSDQEPSASTDMSLARSSARTVRTYGRFDTGCRDGGKRPTRSDDRAGSYQPRGGWAPRRNPAREQYLWVHAERLTAFN
jgi:hypothetical protein